MREYPLKPRPMLRYYGGKWQLALWIISNFPEHRVYVEPYAGAASVLLRKERTYAEIYNDIDGEVVNVFKMARDHGPELQELLRLTPFSRAEFDAAYGSEPISDLERARRTIIKTFQGFGSDSINRKSGFRADSNRSGTTPGTDWRHYMGALHFALERLQGVIIENRPAIEVIKKNDRAGTLFYVDPPYVKTSRRGGERYRHEMSDEEHEELAAVLNACKGKVAISCYDSKLYDRLYSGWRRVEKKAYAHYARKDKARTEVLLFNF